jgi:hypothetical protein
MVLIYFVYIYTPSWYIIASSYGETILYLSVFCVEATPSLFCTCDLQITTCNFFQLNPPCRSCAINYVYLRYASN